MPESPVFQSLYTAESAARSRAFVAGVARDAGVPLFDAAAGHAEGDFADGHHMLRGAAAAFSRRFWDEHLREWVKVGSGTP